MIVMIWTHGVVGMNGLLRYRPYYMRFRRLFVGFFWAVPILALLVHLRGEGDTLITYAHSQMHDDYYMLRY